MNFPQSDDLLFELQLPFELQLHQAISMPGGSELLLILLIVLVVFGHNRIPQLGEALGKGIKNFRKSFAKDETETQAAHREVRQISAEEARDLHQDALKKTDEKPVT